MKDFLKNNLITIIISAVILIAVGILAYLLYRPIPDTDSAITYYSYEEEVDSELILENANLLFTLDTGTTGFTVTDKRNGQTWRSNPLDPDGDPLALPREKAALKSIFLLSYTTKNGVVNLYDSFGYSVNRNLYEVTKTGNSITAKYTVGELKRTYIYPYALTGARMDNFLEKMSSSDKKFASQFYQKYDLDNLRSGQSRDKLLSAYPELRSDVVYEIREGVQEHLKERLERTFEDIGYSPADFQQDSDMYAGAEAIDTPIFNVSIVYSLDGEDLIISLPFDDIAYKSKYPPTRLALLPYFGAGSTDENGYLFVPEGNGALINFNNGKINQSAYYADVYGWDHAVDRKAVIQETGINFPVFGIAREGASLLSFLEKGASYASIQADISGKRNSWNVAYASYKLVHSEAFEVSGKSNDAVHVFEKALPAGEIIQQRIRFIQSDNYVDMAKAYGKYLENTALSQGSNRSTSIPLALEIVGAIDKQKQLLGFPKLRPVPLSTFGDMQSMLEDIKNKSQAPLYARLVGCLSGGVRQKFMPAAKPLSILGSSGDLKKLFHWAKDQDIAIYLDGDIQYARNSGLFSGFLSFSDSARFASNEVVKLFKFSPIWYGKLVSEKPFYLLTQRSIKKANKAFLSTAKKLNAPGLAYNNLGSDLSGNYASRKRTTRESALNLQKNILQETSAKGFDIMSTNASNYAIENSSIITNVRFKGNRYNIFDSSVPFWAIAMHGKKPYTGRPINLAREWQEEYLTAAEHGAGLNFALIASEGTSLQDSEYTDLFGASYREWEARIIRLYNEYNQKLGPVFNSTIVDHQKLGQFLTKTSYSNGISIYVNYGNEDISLDGKIVPARNFVSIEE